MVDGDIIVSFFGINLLAVFLVVAFGAYFLNDGDVILIGIDDKR